MGQGKRTCSQTRTWVRGRDGEWWWQCKGGWQSWWGHDLALRGLDKVPEDDDQEDIWPFKPSLTVLGSWRLGHWCHNWEWPKSNPTVVPILVSTLVPMVVPSSIQLDLIEKIAGPDKVMYSRARKKLVVELGDYKDLEINCFQWLVSLQKWTQKGSHFGWPRWDIKILTKVDNIPYSKVDTMDSKEDSTMEGKSYPEKDA